MSGWRSESRERLARDSTTSGWDERAEIAPVKWTGGKLSGVRPSDKPVERVDAVD